MGSSSSKPTPKQKDDLESFGSKIKKTIDDELARKMMVQREVQLAVNTAKARDTLMIFGTAWVCLATGVSTAVAAGKRPPTILGAPIVIGALVLGNMADMAYGNKLARITREAEHILEHERGRLVPFKQAAFHKFYTAEERSTYYDTATAVGDVFPYSVVVGSLRGNNSETESEKPQ